MKTLLIRATGSVVLALALAGPAQSGPKVLVSAPISNDAGGISCVLTNAGKKDVTLLSMATVGQTLGEDTLESNLILAPGDFVGRVNNETLGYCRFTISRSPKTVRAAACRFEGGVTVGTNSDCVEAR